MSANQWFWKHNLTIIVSVYCSLYCRNTKILPRWKTHELYLDLVLSCSLSAFFFFCLCLFSPSSFKLYLSSCLPIFSITSFCLLHLLPVHSVSFIFSFNAAEAELSVFTMCRLRCLRALHFHVDPLLKTDSDMLCCAQYLIAMMYYNTCNLFLKKTRIVLN